MSATDEHDGERLAPVTFLPGVAAHAPTRPVRASGGAAPRGSASRGSAPRPDDDEGWFVPGDDEGWFGAEVRGTGGAEADVAAEPDAGVQAAVAAEPDATAEPDAASEPDAAAQLSAAIDLVARKLRARGLSEREVRGALATAGVDRAVAEAAVQTLIERGWLSDAVLAEQLVHGAVTRKGMGRRAIAQLLAGRGIDRDVAAAAVAELPDDDAERALEFARDKARTLVRYDDATATRRLLGQLARRGFGGSQASAAVRTALAEARREAGGRSSGVRFE